MTEPVGVNLVVVNYKTSDDLSGFLESLDKFRPMIPFTLTIVNVSPGPKDDEIARERLNGVGWEGLTVQSFGENIGYARACNAAAARTSLPIIAFFNADVRLTEGAVDQCCQALTENDRWGVLGPRQVDDRGRLTAAGIFGTDAKPRHRAWLCFDSQQYADVREAVTVAGSAYFVKRPAWDELYDCQLFRDVAPNADGAFLPTAHYYNETYTSMHARVHGWKVMYFGPVLIQHLWHRASPVGGWGEQNLPVDREYFRRACDHHGLEHD